MFRCSLQTSFRAVVMGVAMLQGSEAAAQGVELDRVVSKVGSRIITQSDVTQARVLKLVDDTSSDVAVRTALENRLLILSEIARGEALPPISAEAQAAQRADWERSLGGANAQALMNQTGMSQSGLESWRAEDLRIRAHLDRQFGSLPPNDRQRATAEWLARLRQRAGL